MKLLVQFLAATLPGNNPGQVVHTVVPLFTMKYNLILANWPWPWLECLDF